MFAIRPKVFSNDDETVQYYQVVFLTFIAHKAEFIKLAGEN